MTENFIKLMAGTLESMLKRELICPNCMDPLSPPIFHCEKGHSFCSLCSTGGIDCSFCHSSFNGGRTHHLERIVRLYVYPCKYFIKGCRKMSRIDKLRPHEESCQTYEMICPLSSDSNCTYAGNRQQIIFHCQLAHIQRTFVGNNIFKFRATKTFLSRLRVIQNFIKFTLNTRVKTKDVQSVYLMYAEDVIFQVICRFEANEIKMAVFRISSPSEVNDQYNFSLSIIYDNNMPTKNMTAICGIRVRNETIQDFGKNSVRIDYKCFELCRYFSLKFVEKN